MFPKKSSPKKGSAKHSGSLKNKPAKKSVSKKRQDDFDAWHKKDKKTASLFMYILYGIEFFVTILIIVLPVKIYFDPLTGLSNSYGMSATALFVGIGLYISSILCVALINFKKLNTKISLMFCTKIVPSMHKNTSKFFH